MPLVLAPNVTWIEVDDGIVAFDPHSGKFLDLDQSGTILWNALVAADWSEETAVELLASEHQVNLESIRSTVRSFLKTLEERGAILRG